MKVIISGGGTGGHIFPAISIANALKVLCPGVEILFVGATGKMEMEKVPAAGYEIVGLPVAGFQRRLTWKNVTFFYKLVASLLKARRVIANYKPDVVVGVGGYASGPLLRMATQLRIPALIQEQNSYPGVTNRLLAVKVNKICVAYPNMERFFPKEKVQLTGNPIRQILYSLPSKKEGMAAFGLEEGKKVLFLTGGSLGARSLNEGMLAGLEMLKKSDVEVVWQTGKFYHEKVVEQVTRSGARNVKVFDFINNMDMAYAASDLIISRAGAGAISEVALLGKAAIFVPSPNVSEDHQTKNAMSLVEKRAAKLVKDADCDQLVSVALDLICNEDQLNELKCNVKAFAYPHADIVIAEEIIKLVE